MGIRDKTYRIRKAINRLVQTEHLVLLAIIDAVPGGANELSKSTHAALLVPSAFVSFPAIIATLGLFHGFAVVHSIVAGLSWARSDFSLLSSICSESNCIGRWVTTQSQCINFRPWPHSILDHQLHAVYPTTVGESKVQTSFIPVLAQPLRLKFESWVSNPSSLLSISNVFHCFSITFGTADQPQIQPSRFIRVALSELVPIVLLLHVSMRGDLGTHEREWSFPRHSNLLRLLGNTYNACSLIIYLRKNPLMQVLQIFQKLTIKLEIYLRNEADLS